MAWPTKGYSELAQLVGNNPGLAIFRRFATLNAQNLLYLQSELAILEDDLKDLVIADSTSDNEKRKRYQFRIRELKEASVESEDGAQWQKVQEIREKLKEYNAALLQHAQLYRLPEANKHDLGCLREWYRYEEYGDQFMPAPETYVWDEDVKDLVALSARKTDGDVFTSWITDRVVPRIHRLLGERFMKPISGEGANALYNYKDSWFNAVTNNISIIISSLMPPASIFALYYVHSTIVRLSMILIFSMVLTGSLAIFTSAKRVEIFTAAAALASVQVVFVGTSAPPS